MRRLRVALPVLLLAPFAIATGASAQATRSAGDRCAAPAAKVGSKLPAPVRVWTGCGIFQIARDGGVGRISLRTSPVAKGASEYWASGVWAGSERGHLVIGRWRRTLWRSHGRFDEQLGLTLDLVTVGPHALVFSTGIMKKQRLYVASLHGPERLVARRENPIGWTKGGFYTWGRPHRRLLLRADDGSPRKLIAHTVFTYAYDRGSLWLVRDGWLLQVQGPRVRRVAKLAPLGLWPIRHLQVKPLGHLTALEHDGRLVVLRNDGSLFASTHFLYRNKGADGISVQPIEARGGNAVAFAAMRDTTETVYVLDRGDKAARPVLSGRAPRTCGGGSELASHGRWLLYRTSQRHLTLINSKSRRSIDLTPLIRGLPGTHAQGGGLDYGTVTWH